VTAPRYYTTTECPGCGAHIDGIHNRYVCTRCDWISPPDDQPIVGQSDE
jgi:transposase